MEKVEFIMIFLKLLLIIKVHIFGFYNFLEKMKLLILERITLIILSFQIVHI